MANEEDGPLSSSPDMKFNEILLSDRKNREELRRVVLSDSEKKRLEKAGTAIMWREAGGFGYISSMSAYDESKELKVTAYIVGCFENKEYPIQPLVVSIDDYYRFVPDTPSLVRKIMEYDKRRNTAPELQFPVGGQGIAPVHRTWSVIVLTGFCNSVVFTEKALSEVPCQENAGLFPGRMTELGNDLDIFALDHLPALIREKGGDLRVVLQEIVEKGQCPEEDARLLLVTGLLLQDRQLWQLLWPKKERNSEVVLYIVAPSAFHDAMNRLNLNWGGGGADYQYRAKGSLGSEDKPPLEDEYDFRNYHEQGISAGEFEKRMKPILEKFKG
ncbi:hypothetical protein KBI33_03555 [Candidatus Shapirobacteria bacterium]|nr:hypothetical protein [Candidatus Shapirobacteria bacterium]